MVRKAFSSASVFFHSSGSSGTPQHLSIGEGDAVAPLGQLLHPDLYRQARVRRPVFLLADRLPLSCPKQGGRILDDVVDILVANDPGLPLLRPWMTRLVVVNAEESGES